MKLYAPCNGEIDMCYVREKDLVESGRALFGIYDETFYPKDFTSTKNARVEHIYKTTGKITKGECLIDISPLPIVYFDTETTGVNAEEDEILQLSVINSNGGVLYNGYFCPIWHTEWSNAEKVNHISPEMVANCPTFNEELEKIQEILSDVVAKGYNVKFDKKFLQNNGIDFSQAITEDVWDKVKQVRADSEGVLRGTLNGKLTTVAEKLGFDYTAASSIGMNAHNSLTDVYATKWVDEKL